MMNQHLPEKHLGLVSFKQEISAVRESLKDVVFDRKIEPAAGELMDRLGRTLEELETADEEIARQSGRVESLADELRRARQQFRVLFHALPVACLVTDTFCTVRSMNHAAVALVGSELSNVGKPLMVRVQPSQRAAIRERAAAASRGESTTWEGQLVVGERGELADVGFTVAPLAAPSDEEVFELLWTIHDLTGLRRIEEQNRLTKLRVQHLSASNQELEEFAHVIAHDLKEPLRGMRLTAGFVEEDTKGKIDGPSSFRLRTIQALCGRAISMVDSVLEAAKIAGTPMSMESVLVSDLVADATQRLIASITEHRARVSCDDVACTVKVRCDRAQAARALANLIANGIKYNDATEKRVVISVAPARLDGGDQAGDEKGHGYVQLCVTDNGVGVPPDQTSAIFRMFSRLAPKDRESGTMTIVDGASTLTEVAVAPPRREGTGAGLAIVKKIVEKHGGKVWVEPGAGGGTCFCLTLPQG